MRKHILEYNVGKTRRTNPDAKLELTDEELDWIFVVMDALVDAETLDMLIDELSDDQRTVSMDIALKINEFHYEQRTGKSFEEEKENVQGMLAKKKH